MSKKQLDVGNIANELEGASAFFTRPVQTDVFPIPQTSQAIPKLTESEAAASSPLSKSHSPSQIKNQSLMPSRKKATMHASTHARTHATLTPEESSGNSQALIENIRKSVKRIGKEEFYLRLTPEEKSEVAKVIFTFNELGIGDSKKISANDLGRIAIHALLADYRENGQHSILFRVIVALNA